jgi:hypothetical protein
VSRSHCHEQAVYRRLGLRGTILESLDLFTEPLGLTLDLAQAGHKAILSIPRLAEALFKCCYKVLVEHADYKEVTSADPAILEV